jgi:HEAT repeat protein
MVSNKPLKIVSTKNTVYLSLICFLFDATIGQYLVSESIKVEPTVRFVQEHKYNPRFEIVWWMVAGLLEEEALIHFFHLLQNTPYDLIGGRHQQLLASCLDEARTRLDAAVVASLDAELLAWLNFEIQTYHGQRGTSLLGCRTSFPETLLVQSLGSVCSRKSYVKTLGTRSRLSESAIQSLIATLKDEDDHVRELAASALGNQSTLHESAIQSLIATLKDEDRDVRWSAVLALGKQSTLPESAIQSLIATLKDEDAHARWSAAEALSKQSTLPESAIQSLIATLKDEDDHVRESAVLALGKQSTLPESAIQSLIATLKDEDRDVSRLAASALGKQSTLPESAIQSLIATLKDEDAHARGSAASALGKQSTLPESAIQSLIATLKDEDRDVRESANDVIYNQRHSLCIALPSLSEDELVSVYMDHLFHYSCLHILSLQVQDGTLRWYTEQGLVCSKHIEPDKLKCIMSTFQAIQQEAGVHVQGVLYK